MLQKSSSPARGESGSGEGSPFARLFAAAVEEESAAGLVGQTVPSPESVAEAPESREDPRRPESAAVPMPLALVEPLPQMPAGGAVHGVEEDASASEEEPTVAPLLEAGPAPAAPFQSTPITPHAPEGALAASDATAAQATVRGKAGRDAAMPGAATDDPAASQPNTTKPQSPTTAASSLTHAPSKANGEPSDAGAADRQRLTVSEQQSRAPETAKQNPPPGLTAEAAFTTSVGKPTSSALGSATKSPAPAPTASAEPAKPGGPSPTGQEQSPDGGSDRVSPLLSASGAAASTAASAVAVAVDGGVSGVIAIPSSGAMHAGVSPAASPPQAPAVPVEAVAVEIATRASEGRRRFEIRLDPPELGRIDVRLDFARDGQLMARLVVERAETLDLLRRDSVSLERALESAGLRTDDSGLQFSLRQDTNNREHMRGEQPRPDVLIVPDEDLAVREAVQRAYGVLRGLGRGIDIRI